ncbi:MAG: hypothetical protein RBS17_01490 [Coriobacteriia bacterium]|jgi:hypothetical protein|nr:hypothetical protein [Coriobacteriia bacterium]
MTKQKRFLLACALLVVCSVAVFSLSSRDYRVYWTARDGTVIGGVTPEGRLDTLSGAIHGGNVEIAGDLKVAGTLTTVSGLTWTPPLTLEGDLSVLGDVAFGANYTEFTVAATTGNTEIAGTLAVTGETTLTGGLTVPTGVAVALQGTTTLTIGSGDVSLGGTLGVTGLTTLTGGLTVPTGAAVTIAGTSTLTVGTGAVTLGGDLDIAGDAEFAGAAVFAGPVTHSQTASGFAMISVGQVTFADGDFDPDPVDLFVLPAGAIVLDVVVAVDDAFNSDGTDSLSVGYTAGDEFVDGLDLTVEGVRRAGDDTEIPATAVHHSVGAEAVTVQATCTITGSLVDKFTLFLDSPTGGTYTLGNDEIGWITPALAYNASATDIQTALRALYSDNSIAVSANSDFLIVMTPGVGASGLELVSNLTYAESGTATLTQTEDYLDNYPTEGSAWIHLYWTLIE